MLIAALTFLKANWKVVAIGLVLFALGAYIETLRLEVDHYKTAYQKELLVVAAAESREQKLKETNEAITKKYSDLSENYKKALGTIFDDVKERIQRDKELNSLRVSLHALQLFNSTKRDPSAGSTPTLPIHDGGSTAVEGSQDSATASSTATEETVPLSDIFQVVAENDLNHLRCIRQVKDWQNFWRDYEGAVKASGSSP